MSEQENIKLIEQIFTAFAEGNVRFLLDLLADEVEWYVAGSPDHIPLAGTFQGREQVAQIFQTVEQFLELQKFQPQEFVAQGDRVVVFGRALGRVRSGNYTVEYDWVHLYTLCDGKITKFREYLDTAAIAVAFRRIKTNSVTDRRSEKTRQI